MIFKRIPSMLYGVVMQARASVSTPRITGFQSFSVPPFQTNRKLVFFICGLVIVATCSFAMITLWSALETVHDARPRDLLTGVCPEIDTPEEENTINLTETTMHDVEEAIFQTSISTVRKLVKKEDSLLKKVYENSFNETTLNAIKLKTEGKEDEFFRPAIVAASADTLVLDNYIYSPGGHWVPASCLPIWKVAIIIPFRDRFTHLSILLKHLIPFLQRQYLEFGIFVVEQANEMLFNRAMLMNVGFVESLKLNFTRWDCFIFHDVDHIPLNHANYYGCGHMPRHFVSGSSKWNYKLPYEWYFGAVTGFSRTQIEKVNGFPNVYWGWGGEDDDIFSRLYYQVISRPWGETGFYIVIPHNHSKSKENPHRHCLVNHFAERMYSDGLSNLHYSKPKVTVFPLYINISVDIRPLKWNKLWTVCPVKRSYYSNLPQKFVIYVFLLCLVYVFFALLHFTCEKSRL